jgi:hypothetical protein
MIGAMVTVSYHSSNHVFDIESLLTVYTSITAFVIYVYLLPYSQYAIRLQ